MKIADAKKQFILEWGVLSENWGIRKSVGELHALLLTSSEPLNADDIMEDIGISQGGTNAALQTLMQWNLIRRVAMRGERKDYYEAEKDIWKVAQLVAKERKRRELDPLILTLDKFKKLEGPKDEVNDFQNLIDDIRSISDIASKALDLLSRSGFSGFLNGLK